MDVRVHTYVHNKSAQLYYKFNEDHFVCSDGLYTAEMKAIDPIKYHMINSHNFSD